MLLLCVLVEAEPRLVGIVIRSKSNRSGTFWPKGYQCGSLRISHHKGNYLKQARRKSYPQAADSNPVERQLFRIACFK